MTNFCKPSHKPTLNKFQKKISPKNLRSNNKMSWVNYYCNPSCSISAFGFIDSFFFIYFLRQDTFTHHRVHFSLNPLKITPTKIQTFCIKYHVKSCQLDELSWRSRILRTRRRLRKIPSMLWTMATQLMHSAPVRRKRMIRVLVSRMKMMCVNHNAKPVIAKVGENMVFNITLAGLFGAATDYSRLSSISSPTKINVKCKNRHHTQHRNQSNQIAYFTFNSQLTLTVQLVRNRNKFIQIPMNQLKIKERKQDSHSIKEQKKPEETRYRLWMPIQNGQFDVMGMACYKKSKFYQLNKSQLNASCNWDAWIALRAWLCVSLVSYHRQS